ncbi:MAG: Asp-tRNA(Asn)/Glu-tRNA(Gln) amidotransferase subunit GatC [Bacteroidota bacterium]|nr:Asp-tRNA(Asn)/Glu-tRNA(Gln) amidotransferase subunit GatC [Bacteroidota bacterium]
MDIDKNTVLRVAKLARLSLSDAEVESLQIDMTKIVTYIDSINTIDTTGVEPLVYLGEEVNSMREDKVADVLTREQALANAPDSNSDYFRVPKVIERE